MKLLDLFCGAGGAAMGYYRAGFKDITGVDNKLQKRYPFKFILADALEYLEAHGHEYDVIHASPPCQAYCALKTMRNRRKHPDLINNVRIQLKNINAIWVIENVFGAPLQTHIMLCGSHFNLISSNGYSLQRHRYFETNIFILNGHECKHGTKTVGVYGSKARDIAKEKQHYSKPKESRGKPKGVVLPKAVAFDAMGIDWMNMKELSEAIPPAYTEWLGKRILEAMSD